MQKFNLFMKEYNSRPVKGFSPTKLLKPIPLIISLNRATSHRLNYTFDKSRSKKDIPKCSLITFDLDICCETPLTSAIGILAIFLQFGLKKIIVFFVTALTFHFLGFEKKIVAGNCVWGLSDMPYLGFNLFH